MVFITNEYVFFASVFVISFSGVLMPGPLFAATIRQATKSKFAGVLIALGHAIVEIPLMVLIYFLLTQFTIPSIVRFAVGLVGGSLMVLMGIQTLRNRNKDQETQVPIKRDSLLAGVYTTAVNAGFILWWLTIGTTLLLNAQLFGLIGFSIFAGIHWLCDLSWYTATAMVVFSSQRFWTANTRLWITLFCVAVFVGFGVYFMWSALWPLVSNVI
ncbi:MAG: LysE family transporter [Candidatus Bathyarchaeia archaeon]|jgi:threonine/homoserine/homoserine lactone efflux protein